MLKQGGKFVLLCSLPSASQDARVPPARLETLGTILLISVVLIPVGELILLLF